MQKVANINDKRLASLAFKIYAYRYGSQITFTVFMTVLIYRTLLMKVLKGNSLSQLVCHLRHNIVIDAIKDSEVDTYQWCGIVTRFPAACFFLNHMTSVLTSITNVVCVSCEEYIWRHYIKPKSTFIQAASAFARQMLHSRIFIKSAGGLLLILIAIKIDFGFIIHHYQPCTK